MEGEGRVRWFCRWFVGGIGAVIREGMWDDGSIVREGAGVCVEPLDLYVG